MNVETAKAQETEHDRQQRAAELSAEYGPDWAAQYKPGSFGCHELLDRTSLAASSVEEFLLSHPACVRDPEWYALADAAVTALNELYQRVGAEHLDSEDRATREP
jgi:hypothetical protein